MPAKMKERRSLPMYGEARTAAVCPVCGSPSRTRPTTCGGPAIAMLCNDCRRTSLAKGRLSVQFCVGGCCARAGAREALDGLLESLREEDALDRVVASRERGDPGDPRVVGVYDAAFPWSREDDFFRAVVDETPRARVLTWVAAPRRLTLALASAGHRVTGVDPARASLDAARVHPRGAQGDLG